MLNTPASVPGLPDRSPVEIESGAANTSSLTLYTGGNATQRMSRSLRVASSPSRAEEWLRRSPGSRRPAGVGFTGRRTTDLVEETHGAWRVRKGRQAGLVQRRDQKAGRDADRLGHVVVLAQRAIGVAAFGGTEDGDQPRTILRKGLLASVPSGRSTSSHSSPAGPAHVGGVRVEHDEIGRT